MKIRTQDARQYLEYGEIYAEYSHDGKGGNGVCQKQVS